MSDVITQDQILSLIREIIQLKNEKDDLINKFNILMFQIAEFKVLFKQLEDAESLRQKTMFELGRLANKK